MIATRLAWPARPRITHDRLFDCRRKTWRDTESGYLITWIPLLPGEFALHFPRWADCLPKRFRTLKAAQRWAQRHRNGEFDR